MASLKISEKLEGKSLTINFNFPLNYKLSKIIEFKRYITDFGKDKSNKEDLFFQELESLKQFTITNKEKREEYINLVKFRRELKKFIEKTVQEAEQLKSERNYTEFSFSFRNLRISRNDKNFRSFWDIEDEARSLLREYISWSESW